MNKEYLLILMRSYVDDGKRFNEMSSYLDTFGIFIEESTNPQTLALEKVFDMININIVPCLCELIFDGVTELVNPEVKITTVDELYSVLFEEG